MGLVPSLSVWWHFVLKWDTNIIEGCEQFWIMQGVDCIGAQVCTSSDLLRSAWLPNCSWGQPSHHCPMSSYHWLAQPFPGWELSFTEASLGGIPAALGPSPAWPHSRNLGPLPPVSYSNEVPHREEWRMTPPAAVCRGRTESVGVITPCGMNFDQWEKRVWKDLERWSISLSPSVSPYGLFKSVLCDWAMSWQSCGQLSKSTIFPLVSFFPSLPPCLFSLTFLTWNCTFQNVLLHTLCFRPPFRGFQVLRSFMGSRGYGHIHKMKWDTMATRIFHIWNICRTATSGKGWFVKHPDDFSSGLHFSMNTGKF